MGLYRSTQTPYLSPPSATSLRSASPTFSSPQGLEVCLAHWFRISSCTLILDSDSTLLLLSLSTKTESILPFPGILLFPISSITRGKSKEIATILTFSRWTGWRTSPPTLTWHSTKRSTSLLTTLKSRCRAIWPSHSSPPSTTSESMSSRYLWLRLDWITPSFKQGRSPSMCS